MQYKIFMTEIKHNGELESDEALIERVRSWINKNSETINVLDLQKRRLHKKLVVTVYYEEQDLNDIIERFR